MATQTGSIELSSTNAVKLAAEAGWKSDLGSYYKKSEIDTTVNGITARVSATESSISGHPDCWRIDRYSRPARVNTNNVVPVPDDFVEENFLDTRYRKESDMGTNLQIADYYIAKLTTYVHATEATTITDNFQHDDASAVYLNDEHIAEAAGTTVVSVTLNLRAGWNKIRFLLNEQTGSDYARFATRISTWSNVDQQVADLNEYEGTVQEQRLSSAETSIAQNAEDITLRATKSLVAQTVRNLLSGTATPTVSNDRYSDHLNDIAGGTTIYRWSTNVTLSKVDGAVRMDFAASNQGIVVPLVGTDCITEGEPVTITYTYRGTVSKPFNQWFLHNPSPNANNAHSLTLVGDGEWHTVSTSWNAALKTGTLYAMLLFYGGTANGDWIELKDGSLFLERGDTRYASQAELKVTNENVSSKVSTTDYNGQTIASLINQSADSVKIQANHVEIDGTTVFTSGTTLSDYVSGVAEDKVDALQIGGRNLLPGTEKLDGFVTSTASITIADGVVTFPGNASSWDYMHTPIVPFSKVDGNDITVSFEYQTDVATHIYLCTEGLASYTVKGARTKYKDHQFDLPAKSEWTKWSYTFKNLSEAYLTQGSGDVNYFRLALYDRTASSNLKIRLPKLEKGNKATDWSPAPEDQEAYVDTKVGGRNYILRSAGLNISGLGSAANSRAEYRTVNVGQSYMNLPHGTQVTISFDLYMTVNTANPTLQVYNTNNKCPKSFSNNPSGTGNHSGVTLNFTAAAGTVIDERVSVTGYINDRTSPALTTNWLEFYSNYGTSNWFSISNLKMEIGSNATAWSPAPEDAVKRTQRIYYRKTVTGAPAAPSAWVVSSGDGSNAWTQKHISISSTDKYIYTCEQYEMADGTLGNTSILLDDTITVIDGGKILTGTVEANALKAKSLTLGNFTDAAANSIDNSKVLVGGRNLLLGTSDSWSDWVTPTANTNNWTKYWYISRNDELLDWATAGQSVTFSMDIEFSGVTKSSSGTFKVYSQDCFKSVSNGGIDGSNNTDWNIGAAATALNLLAPPADGIYTFTKTVSFAAAHTTRYALLFSIRADYWASGKYRIRRVKYELGNKATDWSPAPEDVAASINTVSDAVAAATEGLETSISGLSESLDQTNGRLTNLTQAVHDADEERAKWIQADDNGLTIGASGSSYKLQLDNNSVDFMVGDQMAATASVDAFIPTALRLGDYVLSGSGGYLYIDYQPLA